MPYPELRPTPAATRIAMGLWVLLCLESLFSMSYRGVFLLTQQYLFAWTAAVLLLLFAALCFWLRTPLLRGLAALFPEKVAGSATWLWSSAGVGLALRLLWVYRFPVPLKSDGFAYWKASVALAEGHYTGVFWPPGLPLFSAPLMRVFGTAPRTTVLLSMLLFVATSLLCWQLARQLSGRRAAGITVAVLAVWPGYATVGGINMKEGLMAALLPLVMLLYLRSWVHTGAWRWTLVVLSGLMAGLAALTQPGNILFPGTIVLLELARAFSPRVEHGQVLPARRNLRQPLLRTAVFAGAVLAAILPWTVRNRVVAGRPILITVNGGSVFYRANNPLANASYSPQGEIPLPDDVYEADRIGYREGKRWIRQHPFAFLRLAVRKQVVYLGDDGIGVYETLKRGLHPSDALYGGAKAVCSGYWLLLWMILLLGTRRLFARENWPLWYGLCFLPVLYQWWIDSIFESAPRHHLSDAGFFAVLVALALVTPAKETAQDAVAGPLLR